MAKRIVILGLSLIVLGAQVQAEDFCKSTIQDPIDLTEIGQYNPISVISAQRKACAAIQDLKDDLEAFWNEYARVCAGAQMERALIGRVWESSGPVDLEVVRNQFKELGKKPNSQEQLRYAIQFVSRFGGPNGDEAQALSSVSGKVENVSDCTSQAQVSLELRQILVAMTVRISQERMDKHLRRLGSAWWGNPQHRCAAFGHREYRDELLIEAHSAILELLETINPEPLSKDRKNLCSS